MTAIDRPHRDLCPEADKRDAMDDGEFWDYVLNGVEPGAQPPDEDDWLDDEDVRRAPCPECGSTGACGYDDQGRALIHAAFDPEERPAWAQNELDGWESQ